MATVVNKTTFQVIPSAHTPDFMDGNWLINPDLSAVQGFPQKYWKLVGDTVQLQTGPEQLATDDAIQQALILAADGSDEFFGDGSDGPIVVAANTPLTRDFYPDTLVINAGVTVTAQGGGCFRIICKKGIEIHGSLLLEGQNAVGAAAGTGAPSGSVGGGSNGAAGAVNTIGAAGVNLNTDALPGFGGGGGNGGLGTTGAGGAGGIIMPNAQLRVRPRRFDTLIEMADTDMGAAGQRARFQGGAGGGSGSGSAGQSGGGGGGGGGILVIVAPFILIGPTGSVSCKGGNGGNATGGNSGGGGGGGGGVVATLNFSTRNRGTFSVAGGNGGNGAGTGAAGQAGAAGKLINFQLQI